MFRKYILIIIGAVMFVACLFSGIHYYLLVTNANVYVTICSVVGMFVGIYLGIRGWVKLNKEEVVYSRSC